LLGCWHAELATGRLHPGANNLSLHSIISRAQRHRHFHNSNQQDSNHEARLTVRDLLHSLWRDPQGTTAVEFAIVAPVFIALLVGAIAVSIGLFLIGSLHFAVQEGARCASVKTSICSDAASTEAYTKGYYFGPDVSPTFTYAAVPCGNSMTASVNYSMNVGFKSFTIPVSATACFP
jgi:Flp pilus assembly pilin Flp